MKKDVLTPAMRELSAALSTAMGGGDPREFISRLTPEDHDTDEGLRLRAEAAFGVISNEEMRGFCRECVEDAMVNLAEISTHGPLLEHLARRLASSLLSASFTLALERSIAAHATQNGRMISITERNEAHKELQLRARALAAKHWKTDIHRKLSVIDVASAVRAELIAAGVPEKGLAQAAGIKKWIASESPDYARKPGRRK